VSWAVPFGDASAVRDAESRSARACLDKQVISVTVIAPLKLDNFLAPSVAPRCPYGAHRRFSSGVDKPKHLHGGKGLLYFLGKHNFKFRWSAVGCASFNRFLDCCDDFWVGVPQDQRSPRANEVNKLVPVNIPKVTTLSPRDEERCSAHSLECPYRRIDAAGH